MNTLSHCVCQYVKSIPPLRLPLSLSVYSLQCPSLYSTSLLTLIIATCCISVFLIFCRYCDVLHVFQCCVQPRPTSPPSQSVSDGMSHPPDMMLWWLRLRQLFLQLAIVEPPSGPVPDRIATRSCLLSSLTPFLYVLDPLVYVLTL